MRIIQFIIILIQVIARIDSADASIIRSQAQKREFQRQVPCPATNLRRGKCPGYQIDHIAPLKCMGVDKPKNMQWLSIVDHKEKTRREARLCRAQKYTTNHD